MLDIWREATPSVSDREVSNIYISIISNDGTLLTISFSHHDVEAR